MTRIKITSNPYTRKISYYEWSEASQEWEEISKKTKRSKLQEINYRNKFFPFKVWDIVEIILEEYAPNDRMELVFEGTQDEFSQLRAVCEFSCFKDRIILTRSNTILENAYSIKNTVKDRFDMIYPIISNVMADDTSVISKLNKVQITLDDVIPVCIFGNYSSGKSSFINALIGVEVLPSGSEPVTAKIYELKNNNNPSEARIGFKYNGSNVDIVINADKYSVSSDDNNLDIIDIIKEEFKTCDGEDVYGYARVAIRFVNDFKGQENAGIESVIKIDIPFSNKGIIGNSKNKYVIFDTPGSNAATNNEHAQVLTEAMADFSNGIPVLVTNYDDYKSKDNAELVDKILNIDALDDRFTMIVFNKADSEYPEDENTEMNILESAQMEKMYSNGIFFVSSIMGLGAKNEGKFVGKRFSREYKKNYPSFANQGDEDDYVSLYMYNVMPKHIKKNVIDYCSKNDNLVYINSGLYCVEKEMDAFGNKHSAYNKCRMVYEFLNEIIESTNEKLVSEELNLQESYIKAKSRYKESHAKLVSAINDKAEDLKTDCINKSRNEVDEYVKNNLYFVLDSKELFDADLDFRNKTFYDNNYESSKDEFVSARDKLWIDLGKNIQGIFSKNIIDSFKEIANDVKNAYISKDNLDIKKREMEKITANQLIRFTIDSYNDTLDYAYNNIYSYLKDYWENEELLFKGELISFIKNSDELSSEENQQVQDLIYNYDISDFKDQAEIIFDKKRFLKGTILGLTMFAEERLDIALLTRNYNNSLNVSVSEMSKKMNDECFNQFKIWEEQLINDLYVKLAELNPELNSMASNLRALHDRIKKLKIDEWCMNSSFDVIKDEMDWKKI